MLNNGSQYNSVLVVGDREELRPLLAALKDTENLECIEAGDAADALLLIRQDLVDIALLDLTILGMDGLEILQEAQTRSAGIPVILFSDSRDVHFAVEVMKAGAADYLLKPVLPRDVQESIRKALEKARPRPDAVAQRRHEAEARQAHRLETIGRLTSAVAHDLNNQMTVILGYSALVSSQTFEGDPLSDHLAEINKAAERAASLSRQLLDYSRKREQIPQSIDLNLLAAGMVRLVQRLLGANIRLVTALEASPAVIKADPGQIEQVIMNLVLNARDAMPRGGTLSLATRNVILDAGQNGASAGKHPVAHVLLSVSDTGCGMDRETQAHIFEPFFTTKPSGRGTGLGLTIIAKIVQQWDGKINVASTPGQGTIFAISLPQVADLEDLAVESRFLPSELTSGSETVLIVEDNADVLAVLRAFLSRLGYTILEAQSAGEAISLCEQHEGSIDLLVTDVVLPLMEGPELARRLSIRRPDMKILYMSGYDNPLLSGPGEDSAEIPFIQKPFSTEKLAAKVREVLDKSRV